jgi:chromosome partitioning protein
MRVLIVDADPQGSVSVILGLKPKAFLYDFVIEKLALRECLVSAHPRIDVICGNRKTTEAETIVMGLPFREHIFEHLLSEHEKNYDVVLIDVGPSISLFQTCAMVYAQRVLVPVDMDILSVQGAIACIHAADTLNRMLGGSLDIRILGLLPIKLNRRLAITEVVLNTLESISERRNVTIFEGIRTDQSVVKAARARQFLADYDPKSKALEDYERLADSLLGQFKKPEVVTINAKTA